MSLNLITLTALFIITGGFFFYGQMKYQDGVRSCQLATAKQNAVIGEKANAQITIPIKDDDVDRLLRSNGWMREAE
jgi:hypothetical protein